MRVLILSLSFLLQFVLSASTLPPFICVAISAAKGPLNAEKIAPINCQFVNGTIIVCYPQTNQTFPKQFPTRVYCNYYIPPATTTMPSTTVTPPTTTQLGTISCYPIAFFDDFPPNGQGIRPIYCDTLFGVYTCYPVGSYIFGQTTPINCVLMEF